MDEDNRLIRFNIDTKQTEIIEQFAGSILCFKTNDKQDKLFIAMGDPLNTKVIDGIKMLLGIEVVPTVCAKQDILLLLEKYKIRPGEIKVKLDLADWLIYCMEEITRILNFKSLMAEQKKLRVRLKYGVKEDILPLLKFKGIGRVRARKLFKNGIKDIKSVKDVDLMNLNQIVGKAVASSLKNQVGEEVTVIKEKV